MLAWWVLACSPRALPPSAPSAATEAPPPGGLVVLVAVDQFPVRMLAKVQPFFAPDGGFARLLGPDGFHATAAHTHATTQTCPGHATLVTGASPSVHGIVGNRWLNVEGKGVYCVDPDGDGAPDLAALRVPGVADGVISAGGKVVSVGLKDRAPVLMGGRTPTAVVWFDRKALAFKGPPWGSAVPVALDAEWATQRPEGYASLYPDDQPLESASFGGRTFPHPPPADSEAWLRSPAAGAAVTTLAIEALRAEDLGRGPRTDFLAIGYSQTDYVGHTWGAESWEYVDGLVALDGELGRLFGALDDRLLGRWTLVLSSDHGVTPLANPRLSPEPLLRAGRAAAHSAGAPDADLVFDEPNLFLPAGTDPAVRAAAARAVANSVASQEGIFGAWAWQVDAVPAHLASSRDTERSGDVFVQIAEDRQWLVGDGTGADHGSPWPVDQQVPLLAVGRGIRPGTVAETVDTRVIAPTLAALLGIAPPSGAEKQPLSSALSNAGVP